jgi:hypothetical protein
MFRDNDLFAPTRDCVFSDCRTWRYSLKIIWEPSSYVLPVIMLNPSTADEVKNDPTVELVQRRATRHRYGGIEVLNLFAYRATFPKDMKASADPIGPENDRIIMARLEAIRTHSRLADIPIEKLPVMVGWGNDGDFMGRSDTVVAMLKETGVRAVCLQYTKSGQPVHPLRQPNVAPFLPWPRPE